MNPRVLAKSTLRQQAKDKLNKFSADDFLVAGVRVARHIDSWLQASQFEMLNRAAGTFSSLKDEIATAPLNILLEQHGLVVCRPEVLNSTEMIFKPKLALDIIFVPGIAFDNYGHRLGRGYGFYDRFLSGIDQLSIPPILVGLAMDAQILDTIPVEEHDVAMDYICTPSRGVRPAERE